MIYMLDLLRASKVTGSAYDTDAESLLTALFRIKDIPEVLHMGLGNRDRPLIERKLKSILSVNKLIVDRLDIANIQKHLGTSDELYVDNKFIPNAISMYNYCRGYTTYYNTYMIIDSSCFYLFRIEASDVDEFFRVIHYAVRVIF